MADFKKYNSVTFPRYQKVRNLPFKLQFITILQIPELHKNTGKWKAERKKKVICHFTIRLKAVSESIQSEATDMTTSKGVSLYKFNKTMFG